MKTASNHFFAVADYDLAATLDCGQAFRWRRQENGWHGVIEGRWVGLRQHADGIAAETCEPQPDWRWLADYLQTEIDYPRVIASLPADAQLQSAVKAHRGLRLLRQPPWECLASFLLSSTKQIVQIRQIIELLCERFGERVASPDGAAPWFAFPTAQRLALASESELRGCKMGFRAAYLSAAACAVARGELELARLQQLPLETARERLMELDGVGEKIADCVLLFACGHEQAFPIDVWVARALRRYYFRGRNIPLPRLRAFAAQHWRGSGGYAQQYLFHYARMAGG